MKSILLILATSLIFISCSQKQFSFRKTMRVNTPHQQVLAALDEEVEDVRRMSDMDEQEQESIVVQNQNNDFELSIAPIYSNRLSEGNTQNEDIHFNNPTNKIPFIKAKQIVSSFKNLPIHAEAKSNIHEPEDRSVAAILGFVFALIGFAVIFAGSLFSFVYILPLASILLFVLSLLFSIIGLKSKVSGLAIAGIILASLGIVFWMLVGLVILIMLQVF